MALKARHTSSICSRPTFHKFSRKSKGMPMERPSFSSNSNINNSNMNSLCRKRLPYFNMILAQVSITTIPHCQHHKANSRSSSLSITLRRASSFSSSSSNSHLTLAKSTLTSSTLPLKATNPKRGSPSSIVPLKSI